MWVLASGFAPAHPGYTPYSGPWTEESKSFHLVTRHRKENWVLLTGITMERKVIEVEIFSHTRWITPRLTFTKLIDWQRKLTKTTRTRSIQFIFSGLLYTPEGKFLLILVKHKVQEILVGTICNSPIATLIEIDIYSALEKRIIVENNLCNHNTAYTGFPWN